MTGSVQRTYEMAKKDIFFNAEMEQQTKKHKIPSWYSDEIDKILYATVYWGWLVGKGKYEGELKKYLSELDGR